MILRDRRNQLEIFKTKKIVKTLNSLEILSRLKENDQKLVFGLFGPVRNFCKYQRPGHVEFKKKNTIHSRNSSFRNNYNLPITNNKKLIEISLL